MEQVTLEIGKAIIKIESSGLNGVKIDLEESHKPFIVSKEANLVFKVVLDNFPEMDGAKLLFDSGSTWRLYRLADQYCFTLTSPVTGERPYKMAVVDSDFSSGVIHLGSQYGALDYYYVLEYPIDELLVTSFLARKKLGLEVHACGVSLDEKGFLFCGQSGSGKSTLAALWQERKTPVLSDDRIVITTEPLGLMINGTPWHGDAGICLPKRVPLTKIFFLRHENQNRLRRLSRTEAAAQLIVRAFPTFWDRSGMEYTMELCEQIVSVIPCYEFGFVPDKTAVDYLFDLTDETV